MRIKNISIENFRGYSNLAQVPINDLSVFVGKNDVGKSTILEALDIFFNENKGVCKIDKQDLSVNAASDEIKIAVIFSELPSGIIIDETNITTLRDEYLLNCNGDLEIVKTYKNGGVAKIFINAYHPTNAECHNLLLLKQKDLKEKIKNKAIECPDLRCNAIMRKAIWEYYTNDLHL